MKVLFLAGAYHPRYSANGLCVKNVVDECVSRGHSVTCVVNQVGDRPVDEVVDGARLHRVKQRLLQRGLQWCEDHAPAKRAAFLRPIFGGLNKAKLLLCSSTWPLVSLLYARRFFSAASRQMKRESFDVVVAAYTPIDTLLAGHFLKRAFPEILFVPYYLDALAGGWGPSAWSRGKIEERTRRYEELVNSNADAVVSMGSSRGYHTEHLSSDRNAGKRIFLGVPMMSEPIARLCENAPNSRPYALFAGNIPFPRRDPRRMLEIMGKVCQQLDMDMVIAGECSCPQILKAFTEPPESHIRYIGKQDRASIASLESGASVLVNIGSDNPYTIPCKIFEYMTFLKPILSTYSIDGEPSRPLLEEYGHACFVDERDSDTDGLARAAAGFIEKYKDVCITEDSCRGKFQANRPEAFVDVLEGLVRERMGE